MKGRAIPADTAGMEPSPTTWQSLLVYFGLASDGRPPTAEERGAFRARRIAGLGVVASLAVLLALAVA